MSACKSATWVALVALAVGGACSSGTEPGPDAGGTTNGTTDSSGVGGATSSSGGSASGGSATGGSTGSGGAVPAACQALQEGLNTGFLVDGKPREFILNLPTGVDAGGPWPVVFNWHGLGDNAQNMSGLIADLVNAPGFPFIAVTPEDTNFTVLGASLDWDVFQVDAATNQEARLFDEILACLGSRWNIDENHIHSVGFSLGSILTDMLGTVRGEKLASLATYSGAYFSNPDNVKELSFLSNMVSWPAPTHSNAYTQLLLYGGDTDVYALGPVQIPFNTFNLNDQASLNQLHHDVILCNHAQGHTAPPPGMPPSRIVEFFKAHPKGTTNSPYASGLPTDFASYCAFHAHAN